MKEVEGMTVQVPNIIDRIVIALRNTLTGRPTQKQSPETVTRTAAIAK